MTYKGVIFDLDGTLINSIEDIADAMNIVLQKNNHPTHSYATYETFVGSGIKSLVIKALPEIHRNELQISHSFNAMMQVYRNHCTVKTKPYDGIVELLDALRARGIKLSVLSNKADEFTKKIVQALLPNYFEPILGLQIEVLKKPNPTVALEVSQTLGIPPEALIYVGDTSVDIQTAHNANMLSVAVSWGFRSKVHLVANKPAHIIDQPLDLLEILS